MSLADYAFKKSTRLYIPGLFNCWAVDDNIIRMGLPTGKNGYDNMKGIGIKTRLNLTTTHGDREECEAVGIKYYSFPISTFLPPTNDQMKPWAKFIMDPDNWPIAYGCVGGQDRTGWMTLLIRYWYMDWPLDFAREEMAAAIYNGLNFEAWPMVNKRILELEEET